jgi:protein LTV1
VIILEG